VIIWASLGVHPDLVTVAKPVPQGVLCLISALSFHELTTQVPHMIDVALERGKTTGRGHRTSGAWSAASRLRVGGVTLTATNGAAERSVVG
jgi:hypothetical protein